MVRNATVLGRQDADQILLVEGVSDCHVVFHLYALLSGREAHFRIEECGNDDGVLKRLSGLTASSSRPFRTVAAVLDADFNRTGKGIATRLEQIRGKLAHGYTVPQTVPRDGLVLLPNADPRNPKIHIWLMPDNSSEGMLEDLLLQSIPREPERYVERVVREAKMAGMTTFGETQFSKALIGTYIAWQNPEIPHLGLNLKQGLFPGINDSCREFYSWLAKVLLPTTT